MQASDGRWALNIQNGSTGNTVRNNIFYNLHASRGSIDICADSLAGFVSDYNVVMDRFTTDGGSTRLTLARCSSSISPPATTTSAPPRRRAMRARCSPP